MRIGKCLSTAALALGASALAGTGAWAQATPEGADEIANGVKLGLFDRRIVRAARGQALVGTYLRFLPFIEARRKTHPKAWEQLKRLAESWEKDFRCGAG